MNEFWRLTIGLLLLSKLFPYTRTSLSVATILIHNSTSRTFRFFRVVLWLFVHVATCQFSVAAVLWLFTKNHARLNIFCFSSDQQNPREKFIASAKYQTSTIGNDGVSHKALGILPALFRGWSTTRLLHNKNYPYAVLECLRCSDYDIMSINMLRRF